MRKVMLPLCAVLAIALASLGAASGPDPDPSGTAEQPAAGEPVETTVEAAPGAEPAPAPLSPLMADIEARLERMRTEVRELEARFAATRDPAESIRLQRAIEAAKVGAELDVLRIQADHARREGRLEVVAEIEAAIELMTSPPAAAAAAQPGGAVR